MLQIVSRAIEIYEMILIVRILMSWFRPDPDHPVVRFILSITDPILVPVRDVVMKVFPGLRNMGLDISPIVVFLLLGFIRRMIYSGYGYYGF